MDISSADSSRHVGDAKAFDPFLLFWLLKSLFQEHAHLMKANVVNFSFALNNPHDSPFSFDDTAPHPVNRARQIAVERQIAKILFNFIISTLLLIIDKFKQILNSHMEHFRNIHSQFKGWIISSVFQMDDCFPSTIKPPLHPYSRTESFV